MNRNLLILCDSAYGAAAKENALSMECFEKVEYVFPSAQISQGCIVEPHCIVEMQCTTPESYEETQRIRQEYN